MRQSVTVKHCTCWLKFNLGSIVAIWPCIIWMQMTVMHIYSLINILSTVNWCFLFKWLISQGKYPKTPFSFISKRHFFFLAANNIVELIFQNTLKAAIPIKCWEVPLIIYYTPQIPLEQDTSSFIFTFLFFF